MKNGQVLRQRYRLTDRIATGGMGEVWRAEDLTLHRQVAIKVLHPALAADPAFQQRFIQEARTVASLNSPGLIDLYDTCEDPGEDGVPLSYLVMELVNGRSLSELIARDGRLDATTTMSVLAQCATALEVAHRAGIVHRDIKPANILISDDGTVTVIDFGIARTQTQPNLTAVGSVIGTVEYASPEQLRGDRDITGASDVYSLGVVGYECLTGMPPFHDESTAAVITAHLQQDPPPLPVEVPAAVAEVVQKAMAKDPAHRYESAAALARACRTVDTQARNTRRMPVGHAEIPAGPTAVLEYEPDAEPEQPVPVDRMLRKRTVTTVAVTLGVVLVVVAAVGLAWWAGHSSSATDSAGDKPSSASPSQKSPSPTPTGPDAPSTSTLVNVHNGKCVDVDFGFFTDNAVLADCDDAYKLEFVADSSAKDVFEIVADDDGEKYCLNWTYGSDNVKPGECDFDQAWKFVWVETAGKVDVWQIQSVSNSNYCLAVGSDRPQGQDCTKDANQQWGTKAAAESR